MPVALRAGVLVATGVAGLLAIGFVAQWSVVTDLWPWPDGRYSHLFVGSVLAAMTAAALWTWWADDVGMLAPGALNLAVLFGGQAAYLVSLDGREEDGDLVGTAVVFGLAALVNAGVWWWSRRYDVSDPRPAPPGARLAFGLFTAALVVAGGALVLGADRVFPWPLREDSAVMFGWVFLGDACFFAHALVRPRWALVGPQLLAFLVYDLVLLPPFLALADDVAPGHGTSFVLYTTVLVLSAAIAVWFLAGDRRTRLRAA